MHTPEAKRLACELLGTTIASGLSPSTVVDITELLLDHNVEQEAEYRALLEATKDCKTDEEFLAAVRAVLGEEE